MATVDTMKTEDEEFAAGFNEKPDAKVEPTEDEAFGLTPEAADDSGSSDSDLGSAPTQTEAAPEPADAVVAEAAAEPAAEPAVDVEKEMQRLRSWEGRLKAQQKQIDAGAAPAAEPAAPAAESAAVADAIEEVVANVDEDPAKEAAAEAVAEKVESGEMTAEAAMAQLAEDFGPDFVKMIEVIATAKAKEAGTAAASEKMVELGRTVDEIIDDIVDGKAKAHFKAITAKHPDFAELAVDAQFQGYVDGLEDEAKADAVRVVTGGSAEEICALLDGYKATLSSPEEVKEVESVKAELEADPALDQSMDDAEGVRSSGMRLPEAPAGASDDYEAAWAKA